MKMKMGKPKVQQSAKGDFSKVEVNSPSTNGLASANKVWDNIEN